MTLQDFTASFVDGAEKDDNGTLVWTADNGKSGHGLMYQVNYRTTGTGTIPTGAVKFTVPKHLIKNRDGKYDDEYEMSYPIYSSDGLTDDNLFVYKEDGDNLLVYNRIPIDASQNGNFQIIYKTADESFEYQDGDTTDSFTASMTVANKSASAKASAVTINTTASVDSLSVPNMPTRYETWQDSWREKPSDADDYLYLDWTIRSYISNPTQPYSYALTAEPTIGEVVGYRYDGETEFTKQHPITAQTGDYKYGRYDHILIRLDKKTYDSIDSSLSYTVYLKVTGTVTPEDGLDKKTKASVTGKYYYERPEFHGESGRFWSYKYGRDSRDIGPDNGYTNSSYDSEAVRVFGDVVNPFLNEETDTLGTFRYRATVYGYPGYCTVKDGDDTLDPGNYWQQPVQYEIVDDKLYYGTGDDYAAKHHAFSEKDYDFTSLDLDYAFNNAVYDESSKSFASSKASLTDADCIKIYARKSSDSDYVLAATLSLKSGTWSDVDSDYISSASKKHVDFADGIKAYKVDLESAHYFSSLNVYPEVVPNNTDTVKNYVKENKYRFAIRNRISTNITKTDTGSSIAKFAVPDDPSASQFTLEGTDYGTVQTTVSSLTKTMESYHNDTVHKAVTVNWDVMFDEKYATTMDAVIQPSGRFYDLLPQGADYKPNSAVLYADGRQLSSSEYTITVDDDWKDSGRTMVIIDINASASIYEMAYQSITSWDALRDYGRKLRNTVAYETGNDSVGDGYPDDGTASAGTGSHPTAQQITEQELMSDLDDSSDAYTKEGTKRNKFVYTEMVTPNIQIALSANMGLYKQIKSSLENSYKKTAIVKAGGSYSYKIRFMADSNTTASNLILYDALEQYTKPSALIASDWHGTLQNIDVSWLRNLGADPVIYYSTTVTDVSSETDTLDVSKWSAEKPDDMSKVTAIAIDARKKTDGSDFVMKPNTAVSVYLYMKAPDMDDSGSSDPAAYNNIYLYNTIQTRTSDPYTGMLHEKYTQARLRVMGNVPIIKVKAGDHSQTIGGIQFNLSGTSDYGTEVDVTQTTPSTGKLIFRDIEKGDYILQEVKTTDDWLANTNQYKVHIDASGNVTITGLTAEDGYYPVENTPRIHGDLSIVKTDSVNTSKHLSGAEFKLSGTSYYGTSVLIYGQTDEGGKLTFDNIEKGTYTLTETAATDGYILNCSDNTWTAVCDSNGNFTVYKDNKPVEQSGNYEEITNEPLHEFTILKTPSVRYSANDPTALAGATFELTGTSDYGTAIDMTETTGDNGTLTFKGLEPGVYTLKETAAPDGYHAREDKWAVVIKADDTVSIDGLSQDGTGNWIITDQKEADGKVVITKHWNDGLTGKAAQNRPYPNIIIESYNKDKKINIPVKVLFVGKSDAANVTATLKRNGETVSTATINSDTKLTVFTNQPKSDENGLAYKYTVEASISGNYGTPTVTGDVSGFTISITSFLEMNIEYATVGESVAYAAYRKDPSYNLIAYDIRSGNIAKSKTTKATKDIAQDLKINGYNFESNIIPFDISSWDVNTALAQNPNYTLQKYYFYRFIYTFGSDGTITKIQANDNYKSTNLTAPY